MNRLPSSNLIFVTLLVYVCALAPQEEDPSLSQPLGTYKIAREESWMIGRTVAEIKAQTGSIDEGRWVTDGDGIIIGRRPRD